MAGGDAGGQSCVVVRADTTDLSTFVEAGDAHASSLRHVFEAVSTTRSRVLSTIGGAGGPTGRTARLDGGWDPLGELIAESTLTNLFVGEVRDALGTLDADDAIGMVPTELIDRALAEVGLDRVGPDRSMAADRELAEEVLIRRELAEVLAGLDESLPDHLRSAEVGPAFEEWLRSLEDAEPERVAAAARVLIDEGIDRWAALPAADTDGPEGAVATMLVTQGLLIWPSDRGELTDELDGRTVTTSDGETLSALQVVVDALDLDASNDDLNIFGLGVAEWQRANQPWVRNAVLVELVDATLAADGTISEAGQRLVDDVLDRHPEVVDLSDDLWHDRGEEHRYLSTVDGRACRAWPVEGVRSVLARALAAPDYGLSDAEYGAALALDQLDGHVVGQATGTSDAFAEAWNERQLLLDRLADGDRDVAILIDQAMAQGLTAPEAFRLATTASDPAATDDRVRRIRVLYPTTAWGDPVDPAELNLGDQPDEGLSPDVARSLAIELQVLQTVQLARFAEGRVVPQQPLSADQIELVRRYDEIATWFHHRFAGSYPGGAEDAVDYLADLVADGEDLDRILFDKPEGFEDLLADLTRPENQIVWDLMAGAGGNDTFLGPDGTFRPPSGGNGVRTGDARALLVQLAVLSAVGPYQADLDLDGSGTIHEDEVADWLDAAAGDPSIPPALLDRIRVGTSVGLGEDTFGWDEIGDLIGWVGLAAAITATIVYSGGTAAPLWVQAGLVGLAGLEAFAYIKADDPASAALAGIGGLADLAAAARLVRLARTAPIGTTADILEAERRYDDLVRMARGSGVHELVELGEQAGQLTRSEFLARYEAILGDSQAELARRLIDEGATPAEAGNTLRAAGLDPFSAGDSGALHWTAEERAEIVQSTTWRTFDRELDDQFLAALDDFGADPFPPSELRGGEGQLFPSAEHPDLALKRWHESRLDDLDQSLQMLVDARTAVRADPDLATVMDVVEVHGRGPDWIMRDFDPDSIPLKQALEMGNPDALRAYQEALVALDDTTDDSLVTILKRLDRPQGPSANIHWVDESDTLLVIDMM